MLYLLRSFWDQSFNIPKPPLTEKNLPDQTGKVFLITGSNTGVGYQVAGILYSQNAKVYIAARSESKAREAINTLKKDHPSSRGQLEYLHLDLSDLTTIKASAETFLSREDKLHWLDNNAGVMIPPKGSTGAQGMDLTYQTNILGPFLFTKLLLPILKRTADTETKGSVRVSWAGSLGVDAGSPKGGLTWEQDQNGDTTLQHKNDNGLAYGTSKAANFLLANEFGKRYGDRDGVLHNSYNPGNLKSELQRHTQAVIGAVGMWLLEKMLLFPVIYGGYTELYAGLSPELTLPEDQARYIIPWGRKGTVRSDILAEAAKEDGNGYKLFEWCERVTKEYA